MVEVSQAKGSRKVSAFFASMSQLKTLKNGKVNVMLSADSSNLGKILELLTACQAGNSLSISAKIVKPKPVKKDAKEKPNPQKSKGPRRVRRYPYR